MSLRAKLQIKQQKSYGSTSDPNGFPLLSVGGVRDLPNSSRDWAIRMSARPHVSNVYSCSPHAIMNFCA